MPQEIELPNGDILEFPDGMADSEISTAIHANYPEYAPQDPIPTEEEFLKTVPKYQEQPQGDMSVARIPGSTAIGESQGAKGLTREAMPMLRPALEITPAVATGMAGTAGGPMGQAAGGALGYAAGKTVADRLESWAKSDVETQTKMPVIEELGVLGNDLVRGLTFELGGAAVAPVLGALLKTPGFVKGQIASRFPAMSEKEIEKRAVAIIEANTGANPQYLKNIEASQEVVEEIPGFKATMGDISNDPGLIKLQRGLETQPGIASEKELFKRAENIESIQSYLKEQFPGNKGIDDVLEELTKQKTTLGQATETAEQTALSVRAKVTPQDPQTTGVKVMEELEAARKPVRAEEKRLWGKVPDYQMNTTETQKTFEKLASRPSIARDTVKEHFANFKELPKTVDEMHVFEQELNSVIFDQNANKTVQSALGKVKTALAEDFRVLGEAAEQGDFATYQGKVVHPKKLQRELAETTAKLEKEGYQETQKDFNKWFEGSKVVDDSGKPLEVYHATNAEFETFKESTGGQAGKGIYFTPFSGDAQQYGSILKKVNLSIKNPRVLKRSEIPMDTKQFRKNSEGMGYDGVIIKSESGEIDEIVAFNNNQIKPSAKRATTKSGLTEAKPDVKLMREELTKKGKIGVLKQTAEDDADYVKRLTQDYKNFLKKDPPMIAGKEKPIIKDLKETKANLEKVIAGSEDAVNAGAAYKEAKAYSAKQNFDRFGKGVVAELRQSGKYAGGTKIPAEARPKKLMSVDSADQFIKAVGKEKAGDIMIRHYADDMMNSVKYDEAGQLQAKSLSNWVNKNKRVLDRYGIKNYFDNVDTAHNAMANAQKAQKQFDNSIAAKMLDSDPQNVIARAFTGGEGISAKNTGDIMRNIMKKMGRNKDAIRGLENSFQDFMYQTMKTTAKSMKGDDVLSNATLAKAMRRFKPAMAVLYKGQPSKIKALQTIEKAIAVQNRTAKAPIGGGSDTMDKANTVANVIGTIVSHTPGVSYGVKLAKLGLGGFKNLNVRETNDMVSRMLHDPELAQIIIRSARTAPANKKLIQKISTDLNKYMIANGLRQGTKTQEEK